ncbi:unnamed protein product, partial [Brenthis ino]
MSLLEDVFLQDEAGEAQELERVIEGDEYEDRARSDSDDNSEKEDEAEEDKRRVEPNTTKTHRVVKNPRFILNPARLTGPRGIQVIPEHFKDFKFKGKGHEKEDLDLVLKKLEHWAYRLYPKFKFEDCLKKIEILGKKRPVMVHLHKIRTDQYISEETVVQKDSSNEEEEEEKEKEPEDEFDRLLQQQIELARSTPAPGSARKNMDSAINDNGPMVMPKATSSPSISDEQKERMLRNRKLAEERRLARLKNLSNMNSSQNKDNQVTTSNISKEINENGMDIENNMPDKRPNKSNVIDSSDDEVAPVNTSITVDVHKNNEESNDSKNNGNNSNSALRIDTDSDTEIEKNVKTDNYYNKIEDKRQKSNVLESSDEEHEININDRNDNTQHIEQNRGIEINDVEKNNDKLHNNYVEDNNDTLPNTDIEENNDKIQNNDIEKTNDILQNNETEQSNACKKDAALDNNDETKNIELNNANIDKDKAILDEDATVTKESMLVKESSNVKDDDINNENEEKNNLESVQKENTDVELMDVDFSEDF